MSTASRTTGVIHFYDTHPINQDQILAKLAAEMHAPGVAAADRHLALLRAHGCTIEQCEDWSDQWSAVLVKRLAMFRSLRDTTVAKFGEAHFAGWHHTYRFFAGLFTAGKLAGVRIVARTPNSDKSIAIPIA